MRPSAAKFVDDQAAKTKAATTKWRRQSGDDKVATMTVLGPIHAAPGGVARPPNSRMLAVGADGGENVGSSLVLAIHPAESDHQPHE